MSRKTKTLFKKRYILLVVGLFLALFSINFFRFVDRDFVNEKEVILKEINIALASSKGFFTDDFKKIDTLQKLRNTITNKISYKNLLDEKTDFKNIKELPDGNVSGFSMLNNAQIGFIDMRSYCTKQTPQDTCIKVIVDINGTALPNKTNKDQFLFDLTSDGIIK